MTTARAGTGVTIIAVILGVLFLLSGAAKLVGAEMTAQMFAAFGYPMWFMYVVGAFEALGGILLFSGGRRFIGSLILAVIMVGAVGTHIVHAEYAMAILPAILFAVLMWIGSKTRPVAVGRPLEPHDVRR